MKANKSPHPGDQCHRKICYPWNGTLLLVNAPSILLLMKQVRDYIMMCILCMYVKKIYHYHYLIVMAQYDFGYHPRTHYLATSFGCKQYIATTASSTSPLRNWTKNHKTKNIAQIHKAKVFMWGMVNIYLSFYKSCNIYMYVLGVSFFRASPIVFQLKPSKPCLNVTSNHETIHNNLQHGSCQFLDFGQKICHVLASWLYIKYT